MPHKTQQKVKEKLDLKPLDSNKLTKGGICKYDGMRGDYLLICDDPKKGIFTIIKKIKDNNRNNVDTYSTYYKYFYKGDVITIRSLKEREYVTQVANSMDQYVKNYPDEMPVKIVYKDRIVEKKVKVEVPVEKIVEKEVIKEVPVRVERYEDTLIDFLYNWYCRMRDRYFDKNRFV